MKAAPISFCNTISQDARNMYNQTRHAKSSTLFYMDNGCLILNKNKHLEISKNLIEFDSILRYLKMVKMFKSKNFYKDASNLNYINRIF